MGLQYAFHLSNVEVEKSGRIIRMTLDYCMKSCERYQGRQAAGMHMTSHSSRWNNRGMTFPLVRRPHAENFRCRSVVT